MRKQKTALDYIERLKRIQNAAAGDGKSLNRKPGLADELPTVEERIHMIFNTINSDKRGKGNMLFFVMYDIESNKVRYNIAKYLQRKGCTRIQKSIFLADLDKDTYNSIREDLTDIQAMYENNDSIIICPVSTEQLQNMKIIGQNIDVDIIAHTKDILFF